jgi:receptor protein-tyrosine kinase
MGRIDEAMKRAGLTLQAEQMAEDSVFSTAWQVGDARAGADTDGTKPVAVRDAGTFSSSVRTRASRPRLSDLFKASWQQRLVGFERCDPGLGEEFRQFAANLIHSQRNGGVKSLVVTSATPADGKTLVALNIALVLSESYRQRVLLIDGDLRKPSVGEALVLRASEGLSETLRATQQGKAPVITLSETLFVLLSGRPDPDPLSSLTSARMEKLLKDASSQFDWVIVDTAPVAVAADAGLLSPMVHGSILVVRAGRTPHKAIERAIEALGRDRILGVVLNGTEHPTTKEYYGHYYPQPHGSER